MPVASDSANFGVMSAARGEIGGLKPTILIVLVLYQRPGTNCVSPATVALALKDSGMADQFRLLIYDNSPTQSKLPDNLPVSFDYVHDSANGGLYSAYSTALQLSGKYGNEWILLLDQDTVLDATYIKKIFSELPSASSNPRCAALVPRLISKEKEKVISPVRVMCAGRLLPVAPTFSGCPPWEIMALNSCTLLRVSALQAIDGFNRTFWLDFLDHWLFYRLHAAPGFTFQILDAAVIHELSVNTMRDVSVGRYQNILMAENAFYQCCKSRIENLFYDLRLFVRVLNMLVLAERRKLFLPTLQHLMGRLRIHLRQRCTSLRM